MDINQILQHLPHRYPFLLIDRVVEFSAGKMPFKLCRAPQGLYQMGDVHALSWMVAGTPSISGKLFLTAS